MKMNYVEKNLEKMVRNSKDLYEALYYSINFLVFYFAVLSVESLKGKLQKREREVESKKQELVSGSIEKEVSFTTEYSGLCMDWKLILDHFNYQEELKEAFDKMSVKLEREAQEREEAMRQIREQEVKLNEANSKVFLCNLEVCTVLLYELIDLFSLQVLSSEHRLYGTVIVA